MFEGEGDGGVGEAGAVTAFDAGFAFGVGATGRGGGVFRAGAAAFFDGGGGFLATGLLLRAGGFVAFATFFFAAGFRLDGFADFFG